LCQTKFPVQNQKDAIQHPNNGQHSDPICISQNPARWKHSCEITCGFSRPFLKKSESNAPGNNGLAVRTTIPGIGTGNPGSTLSGCVETKAWMILP
jgi:hypothetical protein